MVHNPRGVGNPQLDNAARTRWLDSRTETSGKPTSDIRGVFSSLPSPLKRSSHSISTGSASMPRKAKL
jgi:hypothetical protein